MNRAEDSQGAAQELPRNLEETPSNLDQGRNNASSDTPDEQETPPQASTQKLGIRLDTGEGVTVPKPLENHNKRLAERVETEFDA